jgi:hypothetical protein
MAIANKPIGTPSSHSFASLKDKQRRVRDGFPEALGLRVHRALSWLGRAQAEPDDIDVRFVLLWIGFNAAYAGDLRDDANNEMAVMDVFFQRLVSLDQNRRIYNAVWVRFPHEIRALLNNRFVFSPFWKHHNGIEGYGDWPERLSRGSKAMATAMSQQDTPRLMQVLFDRLYVLRNQLVHGGATWKSSANRDQVKDGAAVLGTLLPIFIDIMMDNPTEDWGRPYYPLVQDV